LGLLFRETLPRPRTRNYAAGLQFFVDPPPPRILDGRGARHGPAGAVAGGAERLLHAAGLADQYPAGPAHVAGGDDRLADGPVQRRHLRVARRERPRRPLAVHPHLLQLAADGVLLELGDVVADVVD